VTIRDLLGHRLITSTRHSFRRNNATLLGEVGESVKTAQAILGYSDLETTLNTYMHAIPDSQRRAVERVAAGTERDRKDQLIVLQLVTEKKW
jgi:integrase